MALTPKKTGRPSKFTQKLADSICEKIMNGKSLREVCKSPSMPNRATVHKWLSQNREFSDQYMRAREHQADYFADEIIEISDNLAGDPQRDRLRVDARKWKASKMAPKRYGDKVSVGGDDENPILTKELSDIEYARRTAFVLQRAARERAQGTEGTDSAED